MEHSNHLYPPFVNRKVLLKIEKTVEKEQRKKQPVGALIMAVTMELSMLLGWPGQQLAVDNLREIAAFQESSYMKNRNQMKK